MPDLNFAIVGVEAPTFAATPMLAFKLRITNINMQERIATIALRCQIRFAVTQRRYTKTEQARLLDIFGEPERWDQTLHDMLWTHTSVIVPQFAGNTVIDLPVPCTYDFEVVSTKYFDALTTGEVPLTFLFSGTMFYLNTDNELQVGQISWSKEASYRLLIMTWKEMIAHYYPNSAWLRMHKDTFDQLYAYKAAHGLTSWDETFNQLLHSHSQEIPS